MRRYTVRAAASALVLATGCLLGGGEGLETVSCDPEGCEDDRTAGGPDASVPSTKEVCDGFDDDGDGRIDEGCPCRLGDRQPCYPGDPDHAGAGACEAGEQTCVERGGELAWGACEGAVLPGAEVCDGIDNDCNGTPDDRESGVPCDAAVEFDGGDCQTIECPADQPYAVGCDVTMGGGDSRGCAAPTSGGSAVFFKEGTSCSSGTLSGALHCSAVPGGAIDLESCPMNKINPRYPSSPSGCPD